MWAGSRSATHTTSAPNARQISAFAVGMKKSSVPRGGNTSSSGLAIEITNREHDPHAEHERSNESGDGAADGLAVHVSNHSEQRIRIVDMIGRTVRRAQHSRVRPSSGASVRDENAWRCSSSLNPQTYFNSTFFTAHEMNPQRT